MLPWKIISPRHFIWLPHWISWQRTPSTSIRKMVMKESGCSRHWRMKVFRDICIKTSTSTARMCRPSGHCLAIPATQKAGRHSWNYTPIFTADCPKMLQNSALQIRLLSWVFTPLRIWGSIMKDGRWMIQQPSFPLTDSLMREYCGIFLNWSYPNLPTIWNIISDIWNFMICRKKWKSRIRILIRTLPFMKKY